VDAAGVTAEIATAEAWLLRAVSLARRGLFDVEPNPPVGCVLVRDGRVLAEGYHRVFGGPHAEVVALRRAGAAAAGATAYVTLEPCSTTGKTGPCTEALLAAGVRHVVVGCADPDPRHQGAGLSRLLAAGVAVDLVDLPEAAALLQRFTALLGRRRPWVVAKWAMSRDGAIAPAGRGRVAISGPASHALVQHWRSGLDALLVGVQTVLADDPLLTARGPAPPARVLHRVVLDPALRTPPAARVVTTTDRTPTWIVCDDGADPRRAEALSAAGALVLVVPRTEQWLHDVLGCLGRRGCRRVMVEGGSHTLTAFLAADLVDQISVFLAPQELGRDALPAVAGLPLAALPPDEVAAALRLRECRVSRSGRDVLLRGYRDRGGGDVAESGAA